jgi:hypothetical protein
MWPAIFAAGLDHQRHACVTAIEENTDNPGPVVPTENEAIVAADALTIGGDFVADRRSHLRDKSRPPLVRLAKSASLWERRIAIVSTQHFIRLNDLNDPNDTLAVSRLLLFHKEDLIHKATGWILREVSNIPQQDSTYLEDPPKWLGYIGILLNHTREGNV